MFVFGIQFSFTASYFLYFTVPAKSPYRLFETGEIKLPLGYKDVSFKGIKFTEKIRKWVDKNETNQFDCFPSGHTMISTTLLLFAFLLFRKSFWFYLPIVTLLIFSTVYLKYHYFIDLVVGFVLGAIAVPISMKLYEKWNKEFPGKRDGTLMRFDSGQTNKNS